MASSNSNVSVAVIGAGPLGLSTIKNLTDEGFDVKGFEARSYIGGVWKYSTDEAISVQESTVFNSSKYRSAFTDFPFAPDVADYPTWQQFHKYINDYADHYNVRRKVQLNSYIEDITYEPRVKKWFVSIRQKDGLPSRTEKFDKVAICNGYFTHPKIPDLEGVERFEGRRMHAINFHHPEQYKGKNVLVVGLHATSVDVAKMLVGHAKQVYLSHRNGLILVSRYDANNAVFDAALTLSLTRSVLFCMTWAPRIWNWIFHKLCVSMMKQGFPEMPDSWNFLPAPPAHITNPLLGDDVYPLMESGWAEPVAEIKQFTGPKSVELKDGRKLEDVDAVIYCTGYEASTSFLQGEYNPYPVIGQQGNLYRNIFLIHPDPDVRSSIAFIGHGGVPWPGLSLFELQGAAVAQVWAGKAPLASLDEMKEWHAGLLEHRRKLKASNPYESTHYNALLPLPDHLNWLDKTTGADLFSHFGWGWKAWKFWWQDRQFYKLCNTGIMSSAMWRLFETGGRKAWPEARAQIYKDNELLKEQIESRTAMLKAKEGKKD